jgi:hypothetical protein
MKFVVESEVMGSAIMRGIQMSQALDCEYVVRHKNKEHFADEIVVCVKVHPRAAEIITWKKAHCFVVYDTIDALCYSMEEVLKRMHEYDCIIVPNMRCRIFLHQRGYRGLSVVIPHHWDPRLQSAQKKGMSRPMQLGFMGAVKMLHANLTHVDELKKDFQLLVLDTESGQQIHEDTTVARLTHSSENLNDLYVPFNCHISLRDPGSLEYNFKTNTKVSTAAALKQPIIATPEDGNIEVLPSFYPFYLHRYNTSIIKQYLSSSHVMQAMDLLLQVRRETSLESIANMYKWKLTWCHKIHDFLQTVQQKCQWQTSNRLLVYRALFEQDLRFPSAEIAEDGTDYVVFTNDRELITDIPSFYRVIEINSIELPPEEQFRRRHPKATMGGTMSNRVLKFLLPEVLGSRYIKTIYIDYKNTPLHPYSYLFGQVCKSRPLAAYHHRCRKTVHDEMEIVNAIGLSDDERYIKIHDLYKHYDPHIWQAELTENHILIRHYQPHLLAAMRTWLECFIEHIRRDQTSLAFALAMHKVQCNVINAHDYYGRSLSENEPVIQYPFERVMWDVDTPWPHTFIQPKLKNCVMLQCSSNLPQGLKMNYNTGIITGVPYKKTGIHVVAVSASNATGTTEIELEFIFKKTRFHTRLTVFLSFATFAMLLLVFYFYYKWH